MKIRLILTLVFTAFSTSGFAMFRQPQMIPVDRLLKNSETYLAANPESDYARYILARVNYLAFALCSDSLPAFREGGTAEMPAIAPNWMIGKDRSNDLNETKLAAHATDALTGFRELVKKDADNGLYQLGLASLLEQITTWKERTKPTELPETLKSVNLDQARDAYLAAFRSSFSKDSNLKHKPISGIESLVSHEAGKAFLRLANTETDASADLGKPVKEVTEGLKKLEAIPHSGAVTPIIFSMKQVGGVDELLAQDKVVDFDLRGYGPAARTTWIQPETALLVWDPAKQGNITSGQQFFGGYTFQIFRVTGYEALNALDDDGNGILEGGELDGIRAWFDSNSDAKSSSSEVRDLTELGILGIKVHPTGQDGTHPICEKGLILRNGKTLPTWDWMAQPLEN